MTRISTDKKRLALFPGSFNPFTAGHADIVNRALALFDGIIIAIGVNSDKTDARDIDARMCEIARLYRNEPGVAVEAYRGLTVDFAKTKGCSAIIRGVRNVKDFEYERDLAWVNGQLSDIETVILFSSPEFAAVSSSVVRELARYGRDVTPFLPDNSIFRQ